MYLHLEHARLIRIRSANSQMGPQRMLQHYEAGSSPNLTRKIHTGLADVA